MCLEHHDWFDSKTSQSKGPTVEEARHFREELYNELRRRDEAEVGPASTPTATVGRPTAPRATTPDASKFQPIEVIDERLDLLWFIRAPPSQWMHVQAPGTSLSPSEVMRILDGPYHADAACRERLEEYGGGGGAYGGSGSPFLGERCPGCRADIYRSAQRGLERLDPSVWTVRAQALAELQRMNRLGTAIQGPRIVLERPLHWEKMLPPYGRSTR